MRMLSTLILCVLALSISAAADRCGDGQCLALKNNNKLPLPTSFDVSAIADDARGVGPVVLLGFDRTPGTPPNVTPPQSHQHDSVSDFNGPTASEDDTGTLAPIPQDLGQGDTNSPSTAIPEPATLALFGSGVLLLKRRFLKKRSR